MESQNRQMTEQLSQKISTLKSFVHEIEIEAKEHNKLLDEMDTDFDSSKNLLSGTVNKIKKMMKGGRSNRRIMCHFSLFLVTFFIVIYFLVSHIRR